MKNFIFIFLASCMFACLGKPEFSTTPQITFKSIANLAPKNTQAGDSLVFTIEFQDGDGDLGTYSDKAEDKNFDITIFKKVQNDFVLVSFLDPTFTLGGTFPPLNSVSDSPIKGEIRYANQFIYAVGGTTPLLKKGDILKFKIQVMDRAKHKSNIVETNEIKLGTY
jgi:hypothetical protein